MKLNELDKKLENLTEAEKQRTMDYLKNLDLDAELDLGDLSGVSGGTNTTVINNGTDFANVFLTALTASMTAAKIIETGVCPACKAAVTVTKEQDAIDHLNTSHPEFANILNS